MIGLLATCFFCFGEQEFVPIENTYPSSLATKAHAWIASSLYAHEIILLDPNNSPLLCSCYDNNEEFFISTSSQGIPSLLSAIATFLHTSVFTKGADNHKSVDEVILFCKHPCIPLDAFIHRQSGICRHFVLTAAYLLARLERHLQLPDVQILRATITKDGIPSRHTWMRIGYWHFDPYWNLVADLSDPSQQEFLCRLYGEVAINP